jgi:hypothetical protein
MTCKESGCKAYKEYTANGIIKRRCIVHHKQYLLREDQPIPLWCPRFMDPEIKRLIDEQNKRQ